MKQPERAPSWHELVQPGPKGDPGKKAQRLARRAELAGVIIKQEGTGVSRSQRRASGNRQHAPGRLVQHRTRARLVDGGPRPSVLRRRAKRESRALEAAA
jgi:hypothetical protein